MMLNNYIRDIQDFPKKGIVFKDITPLLQDKAAFAKAVSELLKLADNKQIDTVVGIEARGYFFGAVLAEKLGAGFVPIRKPGKLPFDIASQSYALEYGTDTLEMHRDSIKPGDRVLLHDDVLATGGTAQAAVSLIESLGGQVVQCNFLMELGFLNGRQKLNGHEVTTVLQY